MPPLDRPKSSHRFTNQLKSNLFQGCSATIAVGIPRLRDAARELREALQGKVATAAALAVRPS
jgi:hypothetical protein